GEIGGCERSGRDREPRQVETGKLMGEAVVHGLPPDVGVRHEAALGSMAVRREPDQGRFKGPGAPRSGEPESQGWRGPPGPQAFGLRLAPAGPGPLPRIAGAGAGAGPVQAERRQTPYQPSGGSPNCSGLKRSTVSPGNA